MSSGYITAVSKESGTTKCELNKKIAIKGSNVKVGLFNGWSYQIRIGSGVGEQEIVSGVSGSDLKNGIEIKLNEKFISHAYPYGDGRMCYIRAIGTKGDETVEYRTFITLYADLLPEFDLTVNVTNSKAPEFGTHAVKGFSEVEAVITVTEKKVGEKLVSEVEAAQFTGGVFTKVFSGNKKSYSVSLNPIETAGEVYVFANVLTTLGYQKSKNISFNVFNYNKPKASFTTPPVRKDSDGNVVAKVDETNKNGRFSLCFGGVIKPCEMVDDEGNRICRITEIENTATLKRLDGGECELVITVSADEESGGMKFFYDDTPIFIEEIDEGLEVYKAYDLILKCKDTTGNTYTIVKRISTLGTAFHLRDGGNGAAFGKYSEEAELVDSAWTIHSDEDVVAEKNVSGATVSVKEGIKFYNDDEAEHDTNLYYGVGVGGKNFAKGDHTHGYITADGRFFDDAGNALVNMILITDEKGRIIGTEKLDTTQLAMALEVNSSHAVIGMKPSGAVPTVGTPEAGMCYANHTHPYSEAWKDDDDYKALRDEVSALYLTAQRLSSN